MVQESIGSKEEGKHQESIQSSTTPDPGHHMGKWGKHMKTPQTREPVLSPAVKAANNILVVWTMYYINTIKQEISTAETYEHNLIE